MLFSPTFFVKWNWQKILTLCCWGCCSSSLLFRRSSKRLLSWSAKVEVALAEGGEEVVVLEAVAAASKFFLLWTFCISDKKDFWGGPTIGLVGFCEKKKMIFGVKFKFNLNCNIYRCNWCGLNWRSWIECPRSWGHSYHRSYIATITVRSVFTSILTTINLKFDKILN